jgi:hypothetical protein
MKNMLYNRKAKLNLPELPVHSPSNNSIIKQKKPDVWAKE